MSPVTMGRWVTVLLLTVCSAIAEESIPAVPTTEFRPINNFSVWTLSSGDETRLVDRTDFVRTIRVPSCRIWYVRPAGGHPGPQFTRSDLKGKTVRYRPLLEGGLEDACREVHEMHVPGLSLDDVPDITDAHLVALKGLNRLRFLRLPASTTDAGLDHLKDLTALEELDLSKTKVSDDGLSRLSMFPALRRVWLPDNSTGEGLKNLARATPGLTFLSFPVLREALPAVKRGGVCNAELEERLRQFSAMTGVEVRGEANEESLQCLSRFRQLTELRWNGAGLADQGLLWLEPLNKLTHLALDRNSFHHITDAGMEQLKALTSLTSLRLQAKITGAGLAHLKALKLTELTLISEQLEDAHLAHLQNWPGLTRLGLPACRRITDGGLAHLKDLTALTHLDLQCCDRITGAGLVHLQRLVNLRSFWYSGSGITPTALLCLTHIPGIVDVTPTQSFYFGGRDEPEWFSDAHLAGMKGLNLNAISLNDAKKVTGPGLVNLTGMTALRALYLSGTSVGDDGLRHLTGLPKLQILYLTNTNVTDAGLAHLRDLGSLSHLGLTGLMGVTDEGLAHLRNLPALQSLELSGTSVTDKGLEHLAALPRLVDLCLYGTAVTDQGLEHLGALPKLAKLDLSKTKVTGPGLQHLAHLPIRSLRLCELALAERGLEPLRGFRKLVELEIRSPLLTDNMLEPLKDVEELQRLTLCSPNVTDAGLVHLSGLRKLVRFDVSECEQITDRGMVRLKDLIGLDWLGLPSRITPEGVKQLKHLRLTGLSGTSALDCEWIREWCKANRQEREKGKQR